MKKLLLIVVYCLAVALTGRADSKASGLLNPETTAKPDDFITASARKWLELADQGKFDECRKNIVDSNGWFDWFERDRKSLGKMESRKFSSRRELQGAGNGLKRYELKFACEFSEMHPNLWLPTPENADEEIVVESAGIAKLTVINACYWPYYYRGNMAKIRPLAKYEYSRVKTIIEDIFKKIDARETTFFKQTYAEWAKQPDYLHDKKGFEVQYNKKLAKLYDILSKGKPTPWKLEKEEDVLNSIGRTGFEHADFLYSFSVSAEGRTKNFMLWIMLVRDLYSDEPAEWKFYTLWPYEKQEKKK